MLINSHTTTSPIATWIVIAKYLLCTPRSSSAWSSVNFSLCLLCIGNKKMANKSRKKGWLLYLKRALMMMMRKTCFYKEFFNLLKLWKMKGTSMATTRWGHRESTKRMGACTWVHVFGLFYFSTSVQRGTFEIII